MPYTITDADGRLLRYADPFELRDIRERVKAMTLLAEAIAGILPDEALRFLETLGPHGERPFPRSRTIKSLCRLLGGGDGEPTLAHTFPRGHDVVVWLTPIGRAVYDAVFYFGDYPACGNAPSNDYRAS